MVVARTGPGASLVTALSALEAGCIGVATEILVVGTEHEGSSSTGSWPVRVVHCPDSWLTPERWGLGAREATGRAIAFTTDQMHVGAGWARALLAGLDHRTIGVGGPIALDPSANAATAAAYLVRFSAFLPGAHLEEREVQDVPGDNAAYDRAAVQVETELLRQGFWEIEFHRRFAARGLRLAMLPDARATLVGPVPTGLLARQRFAHARKFGFTRVRDHGMCAARLLLLAPLVPFVLLGRIRARASADRDAARRFPSASARLAILTIAWAAGEALGALDALCSAERT